MKKNWLLRLSLAVCLGSAAFVGFLCYTTPQHRINQDSFDRIQDGMTLDEVVAIVGVPPGDYTTAPVRVHGDVQTGRQIIETLTAIQGMQGWVADNGALVIDFAGGTVLRKDYESFSEPAESFLDKTRRWLRLD